MPAAGRDALLHRATGRDPKASREAGPAVGEPTLIIAQLEKVAFLRELTHREHELRPITLYDSSLEISEFPFLSSGALAATTRAEREQLTATGARDPRASQRCTTALSSPEIASTRLPFLARSRAISVWTHTPASQRCLK
jgi:hypothetical protein